MRTAFVLGLFAAACVAGCAKTKDSLLVGYVDAELLYLAPQDAGIVKTLGVKEGDRVKAGALLFSLDPKRANYFAEQAAAAVQSAESLASNKGAHNQKIAAAEAALNLAQQNFGRSQILVDQGIATRQRYDADLNALKSAQAQLNGARAERSAALHDLDSATAAARLADERLSDMETTAPADGVIQRIYRRPGEVVAAGDPVVALLPPGNLKVRFYAPETMLPVMRTGSKITITCDGCAAPVSATISYVATVPQFTPPMLYTVTRREKLVFLVEARPDQPFALTLGLPVSIEPPR